MYKTVNTAADIDRPGCVLSDTPELDNAIKASAFSERHPEFDVYYVRALGHCVIVKPLGGGLAFPKRWLL